MGRDLGHDPVLTAGSDNVSVLLTDPRQDAAVPVDELQSVLLFPVARAMDKNIDRRLTVAGVLPDVDLTYEHMPPDVSWISDGRHGKRFRPVGADGFQNFFAIRQHRHPGSCPI